LSRYIGSLFDPNVVDTEEHTHALAVLAKQWSRKTTAKRKRAT